MKSFKLLSGLATALCLTACSSSTNQSTSPQSLDGDTLASLAPVETGNANTNYAPAFAGQTRVQGTKTSTPVKQTTVTTALAKPWDLVVMPDGRFLVTEKGGTLRIVSAEGAVGEPISGVPAVNSGGQGGLQGLALDPQFATNRMVYFVFSEKVAEGNNAAVTKARLSTDGRSLENVEVIYRVTPAYNGMLHYGGRIIAAPDGNLIVSTGERSDLVTRPQAQQLNSALGKIVRITKTGQPAAGNPFLNQSGTRPEIWSYGHRNPLGIALHPTTGDLWESEMGPRGGDEINIIKPGKNYGWPTITYGIEYSGAKIGDAIQQKDGMEQPVYYWDPVLSPGGMTFYSKGGNDEWNNNLFQCGLSSKHIARLVIRNNKVVAEERLLASEGQRFRDIEYSNGALYAITDEGRLYKIWHE